MAGRVGSRLMVRDRPRLSEVGIYAALLSVITGLLLQEHVRKTGFYSDDWAYRTAWLTRRAEGFWSALDVTLHDGALRGRPSLAVYLSLTQEALGAHQGWHLAWAAVLGVVLSTCVYLLLRVLRFRPFEAGLIGLLILLFPASNSTRIWALISDAQVAMSFVLLGATCSLVSMSATGRKRVALRIGGLVLTVIGVTTYELTFAALFFVFLLYRTRVPWRRALKEGAIDWVVLALTYVLILSNSTAERQPFSEAIAHGRLVAKDTFTVFSTYALPFSSIGAGVVASLAVVIASAAIARTLPAEDPTRRALIRWLTTAAVAVAMIFAAYVIYAPAAPFYRPTAPGLLNRTNAFGAIPMLILVYALVALTATMIFRGVRQRRGWTALATGIVVVAIGAGYTVTMVRDLRLWDSAWIRAQATLQAFKKQVGPPPPQSLIVFFGQPIQEVEGVPVWAHYWDLDGAIRIAYDDLSLRGRPAFPGTKIVCGRRAGRLTNPTYDGVVLPTDDAAYPRLYLYNTVNGTLAAPRSRRECLKALPSFGPGPFTAPNPGALAP